MWSVCILCGKPTFRSSWSEAGARGSVATRKSADEEIQSYLRFLSIIRSNCFPLFCVFMYKSEIVCDGKSFLLSYLSFFFIRNDFSLVFMSFSSLFMDVTFLSSPFLQPFPISFLYKCECYYTSPSFINCRQRQRFQSKNNFLFSSSF